MTIFSKILFAIYKQQFREYKCSTKLTILMSNEHIYPQNCFVHPSMSTSNMNRIWYEFASLKGYCNLWLKIFVVKLLLALCPLNHHACGVWNRDEGKLILAEHALDGVEKKIKSDMTTFLKYEDSLQEWFLKETSDCWEKEYIWYGSCTSFFGSEMLLEYSLKYSSSYTFCMVE